MGFLALLSSPCGSDMQDDDLPKEEYGRKRAGLMSTSVSSGGVGGGGGGKPEC